MKFMRCEVIFETMGAPNIINKTLDGVDGLLQNNIKFRRHVYNRLFVQVRVLL